MFFLDILRLFVVIFIIPILAGYALNVTVFKFMDLVQTMRSRIRKV